MIRKAPEFSCADKNGKLHTLADYAGSWLVVYFYPRDDTPGCTVEACEFRDSYAVSYTHLFEMHKLLHTTVKEGTNI